MNLSAPRSLRTLRRIKTFFKNHPNSTFNYCIQALNINISIQILWKILKNNNYSRQLKPKTNDDDKYLRLN